MSPIKLWNLNTKFMSTDVAVKQKASQVACKLTYKVKWICLQLYTSLLQCIIFIVLLKIKTWGYNSHLLFPQFYGSSRIILYLYLKPTILFDVHDPVFLITKSFYWIVTAKFLHDRYSHPVENKNAEKKGYDLNMKFNSRFHDDSFQESCYMPRNLFKSSNCMPRKPLNHLVICRGNH